MTPLAQELDRIAGELCWCAYRVEELDTFDPLVDQLLDMAQVIAVHATVIEEVCRARL